MKVSKGRAATRISLLLVEHIDRDQNDRFFSIIAVPMRRAFIRRRRVARSKMFYRAIRKRHGVRSLQEIHHTGPVLVTVYAYVSTRLYRKHTHPQFSTVHPLDLGPEINCLLERRLEACIALRCVLLRIGDLWPPGQDHTQGQWDHARNATSIHKLPLDDCVC